MFRSYVCLFFAAVLPAAAQVTGNPTISTGQYNSSRTSANTNEVVLNTSNVNVQQFGKLFSWTVDGWIFAQPLYVPNLTINGVTTNVVFVATMHNSIYAFDANNPGAAPLWQVNFGPSVQAPTSNGCPNYYSTGPELGILSTPVIDTSTGTLYAVSAAPSGGGYVHTIHALDIPTHTEKFGSPTLIQASVPGSGYNAQNGTVTMGPASDETQRTALLLANGSVYAGFGNCGPDVDPWHGWVLGYNASNLTTKPMIFNSTPNGGQGGVWQSGRGLVVDNSGDIYFATGNTTPANATTGSSSGDAAIGDYGERLLQLSPSGQFLGSYPPVNYAALNANDLDFSSSGPMLLPGTNLLLAGGKDGIMYVFNAGNLSQVVQQFQATGSGPCSYSSDGCDQIRDFAFWNNRLLIWGNNDVLRSYSLVNGKFNTTPTSQNTITTGVTPATVAVSANGSQSGTGIVWSTTPDNVLHAFNAENVATELWNSNQNSNRDSLPSFARFAEPTVANGRVYVATDSKQVTVYGLLSDFSLSVPSTPQKGLQGTTGTNIPVNVNALAGFTGAVNLSVSGLPSGATGSFNPTSVNGTGSSTLSISTSSTTPTGTYTLTITGTGGGETRSTTVSFVVTTNDTTPPTWTCCTYTVNGSSYTMTFTAQDTGSGLQSIIPVQVVNATVSIPNFPIGTTNPVSFSATESGWSSYVKFQLEDVAGNISYIDPAMLDASREPGTPVPFAVKNVGFEENVLTIVNGSPGLKNVRIDADAGQTSSHIQVAGLQDGETRVVSIASILPTSGYVTVT
ncbi:MAG: hypothetical protein JO108_03770, partial [Acidobacteriaceae bacterium]|nr:hypothetical protein [Acidobacteriaceae bacterium]